MPIPSALARLPRLSKASNLHHIHSPYSCQLGSHVDGRDAPPSSAMQRVCHLFAESRATPSRAWKACAKHARVQGCACEMSAVASPATIGTIVGLTAPLQACSRSAVAILPLASNSRRAWLMNGARLSHRVKNAEDSPPSIFPRSRFRLVQVEGAAVARAFAASLLVFRPSKDPDRLLLQRV